MAISGVATALIGLLIFDENSGLLNKLLRSVGLPAVTGSPAARPAFASVVLVTLWWRVGFNMLIYLAGLQGIEPRALRGRHGSTAPSGWQRFRYVTVPLVGPSSFFLLIMNVIYSFQVFDIVFVMTGGGPQNATSVLVTYAYDNGLRHPRPGLRRRHRHGAAADHARLHRRAVADQPNRDLVG